MKFRIYLVLFLFQCSNIAFAQNPYIDSLLRRLEEHPERDTNRVLATHKLSYRFSEINTSRAWQFAKETETVSKKIGYRKGECLANINYAILEATEGNFKASADYYMKAIEWAESIQFTRGLSISYNNIGENYFRLKEYDLAVEYTEKALMLNEQIHEKRGQAINLEMLGSIYFTRDLPAKAIVYWLKGFEIAIHSGDPNILSQIHVDMAKYHIATNEMNKAFKNLRTADSIASAHNETLYMIFTYKAYATAFSKIKRQDSALYYLNRAAAYSVILGNKNEQSEIFGLLANHYDSLKKYDSAMFYLRKHKDLNDTLRSDKNFAHLAFIQTKYETALKEEENRRLKQIEKTQKQQIVEKNWLLVASSVALILALFSIILLYRYYQHKRHNLELKEQKNTSEYLQHVAELEVKSLRSQMNPHFIFNSLNSIRNYIIKNEPLKASNYLAQFATLMRKILDASQQNFIYVDEEIEILKLYLELELMRFSQGFRYEIIIDPDLEEANYKIPSMVLQPFIENAIWHGLLNKDDGEGRLTIKFIESEHQHQEILCEVSDNGIGRERSQAIRSNLRQYKSKGLEITRERLIRLSKGRIAEPIEFKDLYTKSNQPAGTRVIIHLPVT